MKQTETLPEFVAEIYGQRIKAKTMRDLKRQASAIANRKMRPVDEMTVSTLYNGTFKMYRFNIKRPNNTITFGYWR